MSSQITWIVTADSCQANVHEERRRGGPLQRLAERCLQAPMEDRTTEDRRATGRSRFGFAYGVGEVDVPGEAEERFLTEVAEALSRWAEEGLYDHLVIMAPPRALGFLRAALKPPASQRLELTEHHERVDLTGEALRDQLRSVRGF